MIMSVETAGLHHSRNVDPGLLGSRRNSSRADQLLS